MSFFSLFICSSINYTIVIFNPSFRLLQEGSKPNLKQKDEMQPLTLQINKMYNEFKKDVERLDSEKSGLSMDTLLEEPTQRDEVNVMVKKLTKIQKAYKILKEKESEK